MILCTLLLAGGITVTLADEAEVHGLEITLGEVATVASADPGDPADEATLARLRAVSLGNAPAPGYHRILRADLVELRLERELPGVALDVVGAPRSKVVPLTETITAEALWDLASGQIEALFQGSDASLRRGGELQDVQVPLGATPTRLEPAIADAEVEAGPKTVAIQIVVDEEPYRTIHVPFEVALREPRWVVKRPIPAGRTLNADMFELRNVEVGFSSALHALPVEAVVGAIAARPLRAGQTIVERDIKRPLVVRRGELVTVVIRSGAVEAKDMGTAKADGKVGELVSVTLKSSGRELTGRINANAQIEIVIR